MRKPTPDAGSLAGTALETLGSVIDQDYGRDAIHLATHATIAAEKLFAGQDVGLTPDGRASANVAETIGIVDPFIKGAVQEGQIFWLVIYPRTITSLRHAWTHPAFDDVSFPDTKPDPTRKEESEVWLRNFASTHDVPSYEDMMSAALHANDGEHVCFYGSDAHGEIPAEFWTHVEVVTGRTNLPRATYFTCSC